MAKRNSGRSAKEESGDKKSGRITQILIAVLIALLVGGSPWWWQPLSEWYSTKGQNTGSFEPPAFLPMRGTIMFKSDSGDYIGGGTNSTFTNADGKFGASATRDSVSVGFRGDDDWSLTFKAPEGKLLTEGSYESARGPAGLNPVKPGLDVSGAGRGCGRAYGRFFIRKIEYSSAGNLVRFVADFEQRCEGAAAALYGTVDIAADEVR